MRRSLLVFLVGAALAGVLKADAQPITTIYSFINGPANPLAGLTLGNDGNFYGTTESGGLNNEGTAFKMATNGITTTLVNFGATYGSPTYPEANLTLGPDGNFYGTTSQGGTNTSGTNATGTVFKMTTNGTVTILVSFNGVNGGIPLAGLTLAPDGNFYGTTEFGGTNGDGTVFKMTTNGTLTTLVNFNGTNGANPLAGLAAGPGGNLYGTTRYGGTNQNLGTVFQVTTNGTFTTLIQFAGTNGAWPYGGVTVGPDGNLYGTTTWAGNPNGDFNGGTIFELTTNGMLTTLIRFVDLGGTDGLNPETSLTLGPDGNFYGTTFAGGANGNGTVFQVTTNGILATLTQAGIPFQTLFTPQGYEYYTTNNWVTSAKVSNGTLTTLYSFSAQTNFINADGAQPQAGVSFGPDGNFYGTAPAGGANGYGTAFKVTTNGTFTTLVSFSGNHGDNLMDALTTGPDGSLYGTANTGGTSGYGTVFKLTTGGALTTLVNFDRANDGANPQAGLIPGPGGDFYGTAVGGGTNLLQTGPNSYQAESFGTVFKLATNGSFTPLAYFNGTNGANPYGGLAVGLDGNLYGTTTYGGISNDGTIFQLLTNGTLTTLTNFTGANGANPFASLTLGPDGNFYGTCEAGGTNGDGTVFQVTTNGALTTLVYFNGTNGANPNDGLLLGPDGSFYGTAFEGGTRNDGTVFKVTIAGTLTTLVNFAVTNGELPVAGLALGPDGNFYGTTELGGILPSSGTVFKLATNGTLTTLYSFPFSSTSPNGNYPYGTLTLQTNGNFIHFYGTTYEGPGVPNGGGGTIFQLNLVTAYTMAENSTNTFHPLADEALWATGGTLGLVSTAATNGTAQITGAGILFTPRINFTGTATINYTVTDNAGGTNNSVITILVTNIPPVANPDFYTVAENSSANVFSPLVNDQLGTSGGTLGLVSVNPTNGAAVISGTNVLFTPQANFTGTATIGYTITDKIGGTNSSLITVTVTAPQAADLSLGASAVPEPVGVGSNLVYSLTVSNAGPATATGVVVSNQLPANVTFVSATGGATPSGGILLVDLGALAAGATNSVQIVVQPASPGRLSNAFQVFANEPDLVPTNNAAIVLSTVTNSPLVQADLSLGGTNSAVATFTDNLVYDLSVTNLGPSAATGVVVSNQIPAGIMFVSASDGATPTNGILLLNLGTLPLGAVTNVMITLTPTNYNLEFLTNLFQVLANETDPVPANNSAAFITQLLLPTTDFTSSSAEFDTNQTTTVSQQVTNYSTELIAKLPDGTVVFDQTFSAAYSDPTVQAAITTAAGDLAGAGAASYTGPTQTGFSQTTNNSSITVPISTNLTVVVGTKAWVGPVTIPVGNFGVVTGYTFDPVATNYAVVTGGNPQSLTLTSGQTDEDTMVLSIFDVFLTTTNTSSYTNSAVYTMTGVAAQADLSLTATAAPEPVGVGSNLVYSLTVSNAQIAQPTLKNGPKLALGASNVTISNLIPAGVTFVSATGGTQPANGLLLINLGSLAEGATSSAQVVVQPAVAGKLTNTFMVFADQADPVPANNLATVISTVTNPPPSTVDVAISLMAAPNPVDVGNPLTYSITLTNNSAATATGVVVSNTLPAGVTLNSVLPSTGTVTTNGRVLTISLGILPNGTADSIAIVVIPNAAGLLTNQATAYSAQTDSTPTNNSATNITAAVNVPITNLVLTVLSGITLNPQTGLYEERVQVSNGGPLTPASVLVLISGLGGNMTLYNATGITNGTPYVQSPGPLAIGSNIVFLLEFYVPTRVAPHPTLTVQPGPSVNPPVITGTVMSISRTVGLPNGSILVEFAAIPGRIYAVQYSSDLVTWQTAVPVITAPANRVQWIDAGPPQTASSPAQAGSRYYRVILLP